MEPTCHGQLQSAQVAAELVAGRHHQLAHVGGPDPLKLQGVLVVVRHAHLVHPQLVDQHHPPPVPGRGSTSFQIKRATFDLMLSLEMLNVSAVTLLLISVGHF